METNESILTREIVSIEDRKKLGKLKDLCVDCDTKAVSHYIVNSATTNAPLVLPFAKSLAVGDTFMTIQNREDFIPTTQEEAKTVVDEGFRVVGVEVFSQTGNRLGVVESYEFDPTYGVVTKIILGKRTSYSAETFVFFAPDFIFIDDGEATAQELRTGTKGKAKKKAAPKSAAKAPRKASPKPEASKEALIDDGAARAELKTIEDAIAAEAAASVREADAEGNAEAAVDAAETVVEFLEAERAQAAQAPAAEEADEDAVLKEFLVDAVVNDDVESKDGGFKVSKGTKLTKELVDEAQKHDALLLLTMSVEA